MVRIARGAGAIATGWYYRKSTVSKKAGGEPVTQADVRVNEMIVEGLVQHPDSLEFTLREAIHRHEQSQGRLPSPEGDRYTIDRLGWALNHMSLASRNEPIAVRGRVYYGNVLARTGETDQALEVFRALSRLDSLPAEVRPHVESRIRELSN